MSDLNEFKQCYALSAKLMEELTKEQLAQVTRMLALHLAEYQPRFGDIARSDLLGLLGATKISEEHTKLLRDAMLMLVGYLGLMLADDEDENSTMH
jgi:hypothetical protein